MPVILFLYSFPCNTTKALDRRIILLASTVSLGSALFIMLSRPRFFKIKNFITHSWHIALQDLSKVLNFIPSKNIVSIAFFPNLRYKRVLEKKVF
jgi:hypothetical protein